MSENPQHPSSEEPEDRHRGHGIPSEIERERGRAGKRDSQGTQRGSYQEDDLRGTQRSSYQEDDLRGTQRGSYQEDDLRGTERSSYTEQPGQRGARPVAEQPHGSHPVGRETRAAPHRSRRGLYALLGIVGLLMVGGLIGGLVAAFGGSSAKSTSSSLHHAAHHVSAPSTSHLLQLFQNVGPNNSANFAVSSSPVTSRYTYRCPSGASPFIAQLFNTSGSDEQTIANTSGTGGSSSVVLHPKPGVYHVFANTACEYRVQVYGK